MPCARTHGRCRFLPFTVGQLQQRADREVQELRLRLRSKAEEAALLAENNRQLVELLCETATMTEEPAQLE